MPSPFPGMDPYLEDDLWTSFHTALTMAIVTQLSPQLQPRYVALPTERFIFDTPDDVAIEANDIYPDVGTVPSGKVTRHRTGNGPVATTSPLHLATVVPAKVPHTNVEIRVAKHRRLVTAIEILSPTNKRGRGRRQYVAKRRRLLFSTANLLEIDLVRKGHRVPMRKPLPDAPYFVLLGRAKERPILDVWPIEFHDSLPNIPVPLLPRDADANLNLQKAVNGIYDLLGCGVIIDYSRPPTPPLPPSVNSWANKLLRAAKLRK